MNKPVPLDKPWLGPISWEPISNLPEFIRTVDDGIKDAEEQAAVIRQAVENPHLFKGFPLPKMIELHKDQRDILAVYRRQIEQWRTGPLSMEQHLDLAYFESHCIRLDALLSFSLDKLEQLRNKLAKSGRPVSPRR